MGFIYNVGTEEFCCETSLLRDALDTLNYIYKQKSKKYASVAILCQEDLTEKIIKSLNVICAIDNIDLGIEYLDFDREDYDKEYGICLIIEDNKLKLSVEKAIAKEDNYKLFGLDYVYMSRECNGKLINKHINCEMDIFTISGDCADEFDDEEDCDDSGNCEFNGEEDDDFDNFLDLYEMVDGIVKDILAEKFKSE